MIHANGMVILTEQEDALRIERIVLETIKKLKVNLIDDKPKLIGIDDLRLLFGAKQDGENIIGFPSRAIIYEWARRKDNPLPAYGTKPLMFDEIEAMKWFKNHKDSYQTVK